MHVPFNTHSLITKDSECPTTKYGRMSCNNVFDLLDEFLLTDMRGMSFYTFFDTVLQHLPNTFLLICSADDWFDYYFSTDNIDKTNICYNVPFDQRSSDYDQRCSGPTSFWNTVTSFAHKVLGGIYKDSPPAANNVGSFCIPHDAIFDSQMWSSVRTLPLIIIYRY